MAMKSSDWFMFLLGSLTVYRLTEMLAQERGPFWMFRKWRSWVKREAPKKTHFNDGVECSLCTSVWVSAFVTLPLCLMDEVAWRYCWLWWLGFSAAAIILHHAFTEDFKKQ